MNAWWYLDPQCCSKKHIYAREDKLNLVWFSIFELFFGYFKLIDWFMGVPMILVRFFFCWNGLKIRGFFLKRRYPNFPATIVVVGIWACKQHVLAGDTLPAYFFFRINRDERQVVCLFKISKINTNELWRAGLGC
jgi:hypothetical protein